MTETPIESWEEYLGLLSSTRLGSGPSAVKKMLRGRSGQLSAVSYCNRGVATRHWTTQEHRLIWIFQRKAQHFLEKRPELVDTPQWMARISTTADLLDSWTSAGPHT